MVSESIPAPFLPGAAFILGGSGGLGSAICRAFARHGVPVAFTYHSNHQAAQALETEITTAGGVARSYQLDAGNRAQVFDVIAQAATDFDSLHSVVYAGGPGFSPQFFGTTPVEDWQRWLAEDVMGGISLAQAALPHLRASKGAFLALSTYQNAKVEVRGSISAISKAALDRAVAAIAREEGRYGVRANSLRVGWIEVKEPLRLLAEIPGLREQKARDIPLGRLGLPNELGETAVFMCSRRAGFINGVNLLVDGGESL